MSDQVLQAFIDAGIPTDAAIRLSKALADTYVVVASSLQAGSEQTAASSEASSDIVCNNLLVKQAAVVANTLAAGAAAMNSVSIQGGAYMDGSGARFNSPVVASGGLVVNQWAQLAGNNVVQGPISLQGPVEWNGIRIPTQVPVVSFVSANGGNSLGVLAREVAVLNDYGNRPGVLNFSVDLDAGVTVALAGTTSVTVNSVTAATFNPTNKSVYVLTSATLDPDNCVVTTTGTYLQFGGTVTLGLTSVAITPPSGSTLIRRVNAPGIKINAS